MQCISGNYIKKLRQSKGYSLREFAKMIYVSKSSLQRWEKSNLPNDEDLLKRISAIFDMSVEEMYSKSRENEDIIPTEKQLTEMQFGIKGLAVVLSFLAVFVLIFILLYK